MLRPVSKSPRRCPFPSTHGLAYLHARGVVHGEISTSAVLIRRGRRELSGAVSDPRYKRLLRGADAPPLRPLWAPPEVLRGEPALPTSDVFSMCTAIHHTTTGRLEWYKKDSEEHCLVPSQLAWRVVSGDRPNEAEVLRELRSGDVSAEGLLAVLRRGWNEHVEARPKSSECEAIPRAILFPLTLLRMRSQVNSLKR